MKSLNMNELTEVQGGGLSFRWAVKAGELLVDAFNMYEISQKVDLEPGNYGPADSNGYNAMGDFTNGTCTK
jgi:hypothetical protein